MATTVRQVTGVAARIGDGPALRELPFFEECIRPHSQDDDLAEDPIIEPAPRTRS